VDGGTTTGCSVSHMKVLPGVVVVHSDPSGP